MSKTLKLRILRFMDIEQTGQMVLQLMHSNPTFHVTILDVDSGECASCCHVNQQQQLADYPNPHLEWLQRTHVSISIHFCVMNLMTVLHSIKPHELLKGCDSIMFLKHSTKLASVSHVNLMSGYCALHGTTSVFTCCPTVVT